MAGRFSTEISVRCAVCGEPFRFLGVANGSSPHEPRVSIGLELRAPIEPQGTLCADSHPRSEAPPFFYEAGVLAATT
jgi:hypothetical protein